MDIKTLIPFIELLRREANGLPPTMTARIIDEYGKNPFLILISCLLSLRARDTVTIHICRTLFAHAQTPQEIAALSADHLESIIYKTGFYKTKAAVLQAVSAALLTHHHGIVPATEKQLLLLPGVGQKTANLVLSVAFAIPAICVDTHVHRLSNLWGIVKTKTPDETEKALKKVIPKEYWIEWSRLLVVLGQNLKKDTLLRLTP